jgi:hypothetical protein
VGLGRVTPLAWQRLPELSNIPYRGFRKAQGKSVLKNGALYDTQQNSSFSFTPDDNGTYSVQVTDNGGMASLPATTSIAVQNVAPTNV